MPPKADPRLRQIKIKTGILKRQGQDRKMNRKEIAAQERMVERYKTEGRDEHDINKQVEVLEECLMLVPLTAKSLREAWEALSQMLEAESDLSESKEFIEATEMLAAVPIEEPAAATL